MEYIPNLENDLSQKLQNNSLQITNNQKEQKLNLIENTNNSQMSHNENLNNNYQEKQRLPVAENKTKWQKDQYLTFLEKNQWDIERLKLWDVWDDLNEKEKQEMIDTSLYEPLFRELQNKLKQDSSYSLDNIGNDQKFSVLVNYKKFKSWLKNKKYYRKTKCVSKTQSQYNENLSTNTSIVTSFTNQNICKNGFIFDEPLPTINLRTNEMKKFLFNTSTLQEWDKLIAKCEMLTYAERGKLLEQYYFHDPQIFVDLLKEYSKEKYFQHIFSNLLSIVLQLESGHEKTNLFVVSCMFYNYEILQVQQKELLMKSTLSCCILKLQREDQQDQIFGFLKFLFTNNFDLPDETLNEITILLQENYVAWKQFISYLSQSPFQIRQEVLEKVPRNGYFFKMQLIQLFKEQKGEIFIRFPQQYRQPLIELIVYTHEKQKENIVDLLIQLSEYTQGYESFLEKANFLCFLKELVSNIKSKKYQWYQNIQDPSNLLYKIAQGIIEGRVVNTKNLLPCLNGDYSCLENEISKSKIIRTGGVEELLNQLTEFKQKNPSLKEAQEFEIQEFNSLTQQIFNKIEEEFGRPYHNLQVLCIKFILKNIQNGNYFINFGLGNGKTLLSVTLAIILNKISQSSVIILVKSSYLVYRDHKKFKSIIQNLKIKSSQHDFLPEGITFMDEKIFYKNCFVQKKQNHTTLKDVFMIIDEYDNIFDDIKPQQILEKIKVLKKFPYILGFSGFSLNTEEQQCLSEALQVTIVSFPYMNEIYGEQCFIKKKFSFLKQSIMAIKHNRYMQINMPNITSNSCIRSMRYKKSQIFSEIK